MNRNMHVLIYCNTSRSYFCQAPVADNKHIFLLHIQSDITFLILKCLKLNFYLLFGELSVAPDNLQISILLHWPKVFEHTRHLYTLCEEQIYRKIYRLFKGGVPNKVTCMSEGLFHQGVVC